MIDKATYCELPFNGLFLNTNGDVKFCCALDKSLGNISDNSIDEILRGEKANEIRRDILNNRWNDYCKMCKRSEEQSGSSQRTFSIRPLNFERGKLIKDEYEYQLEAIDIRWSNTCNLSCVYCFSGASSKWASILNEYVIRPEENDHQQFLDKIIEMGSGIKSVNLLGGEPLLEKFNIDLLTKLKKYPQIAYYVLSNFSLENITSNKVYNLLNETNNVTWAVSFENIKEKYDYVRHGSSWNTFENNLKTLYEQTGNRASIHFTYCLYSATRLVEFFDYVSSVPWFKKVIIQQLVVPEYLNVSMQNKNFRELCINEIDLCVDKYHIQYPEEMQQLTNIKNSLLLLPIEDDKENLAKIKNLENVLTKKNTFSIFWPEIQQSLVGEKND